MSQTGLDCNMADRKTYDFIYLLKFVAIIMITNSHFKPVYNGSFKQLAFGGAFGCALFFFCSGFTMIASKDEPFYKYIKRRVIRILPTFWLFLLLSGEWHATKHWLCWGHYWFLQTILIFYVLFFFVRKYLKNDIGKIIIALIAATIILYIYMPHEMWMVDYTMHQNRFTWLYYFAIMLLGARLRFAPPMLTVHSYFLKRLGRTSMISLFKFLLIPVAFFLVYGLKFFCMRYPVAMNLQLLFPVSLMATCYLFTAVFGDMKLQNNKIGTFVKFIANLTLEIYIVQFVCINICSTLPIYFRFSSVVIMILVSAYGLHWLSNKILLVRYER